MKTSKTGITASAVVLLAAGCGLDRQFDFEKTRASEELKKIERDALLLHALTESDGTDPVSSRLPSEVLAVIRARGIPESSVYLAASDDSTVLTSIQPDAGTSLTLPLKEPAAASLLFFWSEASEARSNYLSGRISITCKAGSTTVVSYQTDFPPHQAEGPLLYERKSLFVDVPGQVVNTCVIYVRHNDYVVSAKKISVWAIK